MKPHSKEWFEDAFTDPRTREPYPVPDDIKAAATRIVMAYRIGGVCDPMHISNVIAKSTGRGDGKSNFYEPKDAPWVVEDKNKVVLCRFRTKEEARAELVLLAQTGVYCSAHEVAS